MHQSPDQIAIAYQPQALSPAEWAAHQPLAERLFRHDLAHIEELPDGFGCSFPVTALRGLTGFIDCERRCCPFFTFALEIASAATLIILRITGVPAAKAILADELLPHA